MNRITRIVITSIFTIVLAIALWYFSDLVTYLIISVVLSLIGRPLVKLLTDIKLKNFHIPKSLAAALTLIVQVIFFVSVILLFIPIVSNQANVISNIDANRISNNLTKTIQDVDKTLIEYGLIEEDEPLELIVEEKVTQIINVATFSNLIKNLLSFTGNFFIGAFSILFMTFFFLKDEHLFTSIILLITPPQYSQKIKNIIRKTKELLTRYFIGLLIEIATMITLLITGLSILGVPSSVLIGFFGGTMNVIPYLGPIIGASVGTILGIVGELGAGNYLDFYLVSGKVLLVFLSANLIDNIILQPLIYSNSVKAHPLEIFLVIMMAGSLGGAVGMILAIPTYTMIRIIAGEFFGEFRLVQQMTSKI
jgi:predicted PurR-regulated permease PerM